MKDDEKAKIILEEISKFVELNKDYEEWYLYGIKSGLCEIEIQELSSKKSPCAETQKAKMVCETNDINFFTDYIKKIRSESIKGAS